MSDAFCILVTGAILLLHLKFNDLFAMRYYLISHPRVKYYWRVKTVYPFLCEMVCDKQPDNNTITIFTTTTRII